MEIGSMEGASGLDWETAVSHEDDHELKSREMITRLFQDRMQQKERMFGTDAPLPPVTIDTSTTVYGGNASGALAISIENITTITQPLPNGNSVFFQAAPQGSAVWGGPVNGSVTFSLGANF